MSDRLRGRSLLALVALTLGLATSACQSEDAPGRPPAASGSGPAVVDQTLVAFLSKARAANHAADLALDKGDRKAALGHLRRLTEGARPALSPEVAEVLADAHARVAEILAADGDFAEAEKEVDRGLAHAKDPTLFRANLFMARGVVQERRMKALSDAGDEAGAEAARAAALEAFDTAMTLQEKVIDEALREEPAE